MLLAVITCGCDGPSSVRHPGDENDCDPAFTTCNWSDTSRIGLSTDTLFNYYSGTSVDTVVRYHYNLTGGDKLVFEYCYTSEDCKNILDENWSEKLVFELDKSLSEFECSDSALADLQCVYQQYGFLFPRGADRVLKGTISGNKTSPKVWKITAAVEIIYPNWPSIPEFTPKTIRFTEDFSKK
ncbi:MAG: hypothetical protein U0T82_00730 [Bacteroidales bacterium]